METVLRLLKQLGHDDVLRLMGLERRHPLQRASASFLSVSVGALAGLGAGLLLAPRSGAELRAHLVGQQLGARSRRPVGSRKVRGLTRSGTKPRS